MTVGQIQLTNPSSGNVTITSLTLSWTGGAGQVASAELVENGNVVATATLNGSSAVFSLSGAAAVISGGGTNTYEVVVTVSATAATGPTTFAFTGATGSNGQAVAFSGLPVSGSVVTIVAATATPTLTAVPTSTATPVPVPVVGPPYPNPVTGPSPITVNIQVPGPSTVTMDVFTVAFRKIVSQSKEVSNTGALTWNERDEWGNAVADGLYYLRVQVSGSQPLTKIFKVLITR